MMRPASASLCLLAAFAAGLSAQGEPIDYAMVAKIRSEGFRNSKVMDHLFYLTDVHGPRLAGSPNYMKAANWAKERLTKMGLSNARLDAWGELGPGWSLEDFRLDLLKPSYARMIGWPKAGSPSTDGTIEAAPILVVVEKAEDLEKYKGKLKGAIVLNGAARAIYDGLTPSTHRFTKEELDERAAASNMARPRGTPTQASARVRNSLRRGRGGSLRAAVSALYREEGVAVLLEPSRRGGDGTIFVTSNRSRGGGKPIPSIVMAAEHYNRLVRLAEHGIATKVRVKIDAKLHEDDPQDYNILAEIPGTDPKLKDEVVMVGGHFDSWHTSTGATDNGCGSAVAMEVVRILTAIDAKPKRTIRVALWGAEERGLLGSRAYVTREFGTASKPTPAHSNFAAYFNLDNGTGRIRGVYQQGNRAVGPIFAAWLKPFHDLGAQTLTINNTRGTDHQSFDRAGLPGFQFIQDPVAYSTRTHHTNMDDYDHVVAEDLQQASVIIASFVYHAAMREEKLPRKPPSARTERRRRRR